MRAVFDRIGRNHAVAPLDLTTDDPSEWCAQIERYARRFLASRFYEVDLYPGPPTMPDRGTITVGAFQSGGTFTLEAAA